MSLDFIYICILEICQSSIRIFVQKDEHVKLIARENFPLADANRFLRPVRLTFVAVG